jgi:glycosyltransferase involved in cell wall biosynthesis
MKSYLLVTGDFVKTGGMDRANFALADYLARQGKQVHLVAHRVAPELLAYPNVTFHRVPKVANSYLLSGPLLNWVGRSRAQQIIAMGGRVLVNGGNCQLGDIICICTPKASKVKFLGQSNQISINWVHYVHAAYRPRNQVGLLRGLKGEVSHQLYLSAERRALRSAQVIIANSESTKRDLIKRLAIAPQQIHTVYYGTDPHSFYPATPQERTQLRHQLGWSQELPIVVFVGALGDRRKGFDTLFSAWQRLCADPSWDANLVAIGVGAELPLWQKRAAKVGIASRIHFLGFRSDVPDLLRAADCLVAPTRYEAYGLGVHEALCCGLPALVSATAGVAERYPPDLSDLLLPDPENAADLAARLRCWRNTADKYSKEIRSFSEKLRSYSWNDMAQSILEKIEGKE